MVQGRGAGDGYWMNRMKIYNSLTRRKEELRTIEPGKVRMYVCGMTVYDYCHVGHARVMVVFDVVRRFLAAQGWGVTYVRNITDIDDKIIRRASENQEPIEALTGRYIRAMHEDAAALGVLPPDVEPRATQCMAQIIAMIETLIARQFAYVADNGDVFFDVSRFDGYGRLSGENLAQLRAGERVEIDQHKADPLDFVLWKSAKAGEPQWPSPWGPGRPGWHIECSAMSMHYLGEHFDIHGGGMDLKFPHHENEIAQSEAATGRPFVNIWMHNGFVQVDNEKMSKSVGNFFTVREVLKHYPAEVLRYFILSSHYRSPLNYSEENLQHAKAALERLYMALRDLPALPQAAPDPAFVRRFTAAMEDDFNTPVALAVLFEAARQLNIAKEQHDTAAMASLAATLHQCGDVLGLLGQPPESFLRGGCTGQGGLSDADIERLLGERSAARKARDFGRADRIRDELAAAGVVIEDYAGGTRWRRS